MSDPTTIELDIRVGYNQSRMTQTTARLIAASHDGIEEAAKLVLAGRLVAYPTDTVYGLGCDPFSKEAVDRLIDAKQRPKGALPILVNSMGAAKKIGEFNKTSINLAGRFWPGPLTLVVPVRSELPVPVTNGSPFVGLRIPKHETALNLIEKCGGRIIGTSANISGHPSPSTANEVLSQLGDRIDLILDGGPTPLGKESTVAKIVGNAVEVVREGAVSRDEILKALKID
jgi:L-threonylcarbamoyladenylate synthase